MHCGQHGKRVHQNGSEFTYRTEEEFPLKICENGQRKLYKTYMKVLTMAVAIVKCEIVILKQSLTSFIYTQNWVQFFSCFLCICYGI